MINKVVPENLKMDFLLQLKITAKSGVSLTFCFAP